MTEARFNPEFYKETTRQQWQTAAKAWNDWGDTLRTWLGPATDTMMDMAGISPGDRVLDVAAGAGDQSFQIAGRVGPDGYVLATDISSNILDYARAGALARGLSQIETKVVDGEALEVAPESFDVAVSRVGLIYFPDQQKALGNIRRALKPGGRFAAIVYAPADTNQFFSLPVSIIRAAAQLAPPLKGQPGPFSLGASGVLSEALLTAGFGDVQEVVINAPVLMDSAADCVRFERESFGALHQMLAGLSVDKQDATWVEIERQLGQFETDQGFVGPCQLVLAVGTK